MRSTTSPSEKSPFTIDGFFGATSIERLAAERGIKAQTEAFKSIKK